MHGGRRNRIALGVGLSQVKCLSRHVGMASYRGGRSQRRSLLTHNKIDRKFVTGREIGDSSITSNQIVWVKSLIKCCIVSSFFSYVYSSACM